MKTLPFTIILLFFFAFSLTAQNLLLPTHYKYKNTLRVCEQVAKTFSDLRQVPQLKMPKGKSDQIARFWPEPEIQLTIDEKLYDLCREMGKDSLSALAFIISHELTHYFYNHRHPFGFANPQNQSNNEIEMQADLYGLINAFAAGYQSFKVAKPILEKIYRAYQLEDKLTGYATKNERLESIEQRAKQAKGLASTFEAGKFLYLKGEYAAAEHCFKHVSRTIPAKEVLNNLGLTQLQQALSRKQISSIQMPFKLPVELDAENRLMNTGQRNKDEEKNKETDALAEALIEESILNFEKAISLDKEYSVAYINLATAKILLDNYGTAGDMLDKLRKNTQSIPPDAYLLRAIIHLHYKEYDAAQTNLDRANGAFEIEYNRQAASWIKKGINEEAVKDSVKRYIMRPSAVFRSQPLSIEKSMGNLMLPLTNKLSVDYEQNLPQPNLVHIQYSVLNDLHAYKILLKDGTFQVIQSFTQTPDVQTKQGIKSGDTIETLQLKYGLPSRIVTIGAGHFYCYDQARIYFRTEGSHVDGWLIYQKSN